MNDLSPDTLPKDDLLKREKFAKQIVTSLTTSFEAVDESIVIGICGKWGSGKTTLLSYIEKELKNSQINKDEICIIQFNPWANSGLGELQRDLLENILRNLEKVNWKERAKSANEVLKKYLNYLNYLKFVKHVHPVAKNIVNAVNEYNKKVSVISIEDLKTKINQLIKEKNIKLYVFVDDLDRLDPIEVTEIFKTIKLSANFLNTVFIVAYDKPVVIECLKIQYKGKAEDYLEKIIQVDFIIPEILEEDIENIFFDRLRQQFKKNDIKEGESDVFQLWKRRGLREYFHTLRDINRYFNSLALSLPNIKENINISDFIALEGIKVFDFEAYDNLYGIILEIKRKAVFQSASFDSNTFNHIQNTITKSILNYLFITPSSITLSGEPMIKKRLRDSEFYQRYFTLYVPSTDVAEEILSQYLLNGSNKQSILNNCLLENNLDNLLRRLADKDIVIEYKSINVDSFNNLINFFDSNEEAITEDRFELIWAAYFNLINSCEDKYSAAIEGIRSLEMNSGSVMPLRLVMNHFIILFYDDGRADPHLHGEVEKQIRLHIDKLRTGIVENLKRLHAVYFSKIATGKGNWVCVLALYSYAKNEKNLFLNDVEKYFESPSFLYFLMRKNFVMFSDKVRPDCITLDRKYIFFNDNLFSHFIRRLKQIKTGELKDEEEKVVSMFLEHVSKLDKKE